MIVDATRRHYTHVWYTCAMRVGIRAAVVVAAVALAGDASAQSAGPPAPPTAAPVPVGPEPPEDQAYGRRHSLNLALSLGLGSGTGGARYAGGAGLAYFVATGIAPGVDFSGSGGSGLLTTGNLTGTLRLVPLRTDAIALFVIGRAGRLFIASHDDAWAAGGGAGVVVATGPRTGLQIAYEVLRLWPRSHCADLSNGCRLDAFGLGLIVGL